MPAPVLSKLFLGRGRSVVTLSELGKPPKQAGTAEATGDPEMLLPPGVPVPRELQLLPAQPGVHWGCCCPERLICQDSARTACFRSLLQTP